MQGSKRARSTPSISNKGSIYGIMGGLSPRTGVSNVGTYRHIPVSYTHLTLPTTPYV